MEADFLPPLTRERVFNEPGPSSKRPLKLQGRDMLNAQLQRLTPEDRAEVLAKLNPPAPEPEPTTTISAPTTTLLGVLIGAGLLYAGWRLTRSLDGSVAKETVAALVPENLPSPQ